MSVIHTPNEPTANSRQIVLIVFTLLALLVLLLRFWYYQVVNSEDLLKEASQLRRVQVSKLAPRGIIVDRKGKPLASVASKFVVTAIPSEIQKNPWVLDKVASMVGADKADLEEKVEDGEWRKHFPTAIYVGADIEVATKIAEAGNYLPGINVETQPMRSTIAGQDYSHILGYVWTPSDRDLNRLEEIGVQEPAPYVGKDGIERFYEKELMGSAGGEVFEVNNKTAPLRMVDLKAAVPGKRLVLSIDTELQHLARQLLYGRKGAVVAMDPNNGDILAMASSPSYEASLFEGGIRKTDWQMLSEDESGPLTNRAVMSRYSPGSTFKIVTTIASVLAGKFSPTRTVYCGGYYQVGNRRTKCMGHHGAITFDRAFRKSCNTYFITIGYEAGIDKLCEASQLCGLGHKTGVDLPAEIRGLVPDAEYRAKRPDRWYPGNTVNICIGQGEIAATPLQMATLACLVANDGKSYVPRLVRAMSDPTQSRTAKELEPKLYSNVEAPIELWTGLKEAMVGVIQDGTAGAARIEGITWGGKTGSTEHRKGAKTHSWFIGIAPIENPKIAIAVIVEESGHGGDIAAPAARQIVERYLKPRPKPTLPNPNLAQATRTAISATGLGTVN